MLQSHDYLDPNLFDPRPGGSPQALPKALGAWESLWKGQKTRAVGRPWNPRDLAEMEVLSPAVVEMELAFIGAELDRIFLGSKRTLATVRVGRQASPALKVLRRGRLKR